MSSGLLSDAQYSNHSLAPFRFNALANSLASLYGRNALSWGATVPVPNQSPNPLKSFL